VKSDREAWSVWARAALTFVANTLAATLVGAPYTYTGESLRDRVGPRWLWYFWVRLPPVLCASYFAFPSLCRAAARYFPASPALNQVITSLFAPIVSLIYAIIAGQVVVSLWTRLYSIRTLLSRELAALEILERKLPEGDTTEKLFAEHVVGIEKYAIEQGTVAPNYYNKVAELASLPSLRGEDAVQDLLESLADIRAERRATTEQGYPRTLWGTLRSCAIILIGCFLILAQGFGNAGAVETRGVRIIFCLFVLTVFWVNHLCRDLAELNYGEFQIDEEVLRRDTALAGMLRRAEEILGKR